MTGRVGAVLAAAGRGERLGGPRPKALCLLAGEPLLVHAVRALRAATVLAGCGPECVVVAAPAELVGEVAALLAGAAVVVPGGATRHASVRAALAALPASCTAVLVHDAARALAPPALVDAVAGAVLAGAPAVVPGLAVSDTIKEVDAAGLVRSTPARASLRAVQTPQGFRRDVLAAAHAGAAGPAITDDAGLVEALGWPVQVLPGDPRALKVTTPADLVVLEALLAADRVAR